MHSVAPTASDRVDRVHALAQRLCNLNVWDRLSPVALENALGPRVRALRAAADAPVTVATPYGFANEDAATVQAYAAPASGARRRTCVRTANVARGIARQYFFSFFEGRWICCWRRPRAWAWTRPQH